MKKLLGLFIFIFLFTISIFGRNPCFANCTFSAGVPPVTCSLMNQGVQWCDFGVAGSETDPILKVCSGLGPLFPWVEVEKNELSLFTPTNKIMLANDFSVTGTRILDFGVNKLTNLAAATATGDAVRFDEAILTTGAQSKSGILTFTTLPESSVTPTTANQLTRKVYVDTLGGGLMVGASTSLDFGGNTLTMIGPATVNGDAVRFDEAILTTGAQSKSGILTFTTLPESSVTPTTANQLTRKAYVDGLSPKIFAATANGGPSGTTTETSLFGSGVGSQTIAANTLAIGSVIRISLKGRIGLNNPDTTTIRVKLGSVVLNTVNPFNPGGVSNAPFTCDALLTCRSIGASGSVSIAGSCKVGNPPTSTAESIDLFNVPSTIDTTANQVVDVTATNSNPGSDNVTIGDALIELFK